jgi:5-formyltetrahydrofolate cyclo-ligase
MIKNTLRTANVKRKASHLQHSEGIFSNICSLIKWDETPTIAGYWPLIGEINDLTFLEYCYERGLRCALPFITNAASPLRFKTWKPCDLLEPGMYGIPSPSPHAIDLIPDILLIPLVAFDRSCYRLGKGGGFYDRTLEALRKNHTVLAIGLGYDQQEVERIPRELHDQQLDYIVTPAHIIGIN